MKPIDLMRRLAAIGLAVICAGILIFGFTVAYKLMTDNFGNYGWFGIPVATFPFMMIVLPLLSVTHGLWISGSPERRAQEVNRKAAEQSRFSQSGSRDHPGF